MTDRIETTGFHDWHNRSQTIQRDPIRIKGIIAEIAAEIRAQDEGRSNSMIDGGSLEYEVSWLSRNMDKPVVRQDLIRTAAHLVMEVALFDLTKPEDEGI